MNWKKHVSALGAVLLCASALAQGADTPTTAEAAPAVKASAPQPATPVPAGTLRTPAATATHAGRACTAARAADCAAPPAVSSPATAVHAAAPQGPSAAQPSLSVGQTGAPDAAIELAAPRVLRDAPANDECANATAVTGPYPTTVCSTNVGATTDCPTGWNGDAVWYAVELPYAVNNLVADYCASGFSLSSFAVGTVLQHNCGECDAPVWGTYVWHDCGAGEFNPSVHWNDLPGPGTIMVPVYLNPAHDFCVEFNVTEVLPPPNDECIDAELVTGPYPTTVCGTNQGSSTDCPGVLDWNAVWYEIELPYTVNTVETDYCATALGMGGDEIGIVYYPDCNDCSAAVAGNYQWHNCPNFNWNPEVWWRDIPGPGSILIPVYINPSHEFCFDLNVRDGACEFDCPTNGVVENEVCGTRTNDGCNLMTPQFEPLAFDQTVCGTGWADNGERDTDWYEFTIAEPMTLTFTVESQFLTGVSTGLMEPSTPGVVGCDQLTGVINPWSTGGDCEEVTVVYNALPGTYWYFVGPDGWFDMPCGGRNDYQLTMTGVPWEVRGACCDEDSGSCADDVRLQDCPASARFVKD
ncbi:MAG TPA: hypothetical protein P5572_18310, partial [Phycisphaerae bacterium]|nr:hypothetical protein [Phycisphaerae bacterium]